jgi:hypothetical protein
MKKLRNIIFIVVSITSLIAECQNNLDQATHNTLENAQKLRHKLDTISLENQTQNTNLSIEQIISLLLQTTLTNSTLTNTLDNRKKPHGQLRIAATWFQATHNIKSWISYLAVHNQMFIAIEKEFKQLEPSLKLHDFLKEIKEIILSSLRNAIIELQDDATSSKDNITSLVHAYQDYEKLFNGITF